MATVEVKNITKKFDDFYALNDVSFKVEEKDILFLFGPNGAGKTTLLELICGLLRPTQGKVSILNQEIPFERPKDKALLGAVFTDSFLYKDLTVEENLNFYAKMNGIKDAKARVHELIDLFGLKSKASSPIKNLSTGLEKRASISRAFINSPKVLLLDEPFSGLDEESCAKIIETLRRINSGGCTIIFSSHDTVKAKCIATKKALLDSGKLITLTGVSGT